MAEDQDEFLYIANGNSVKPSEMSNADLASAVHKSIARAFDRYIQSQQLCCVVEGLLKEVNSRDAFTANGELTNHNLFDILAAKTTIVETQDEVLKACGKVTA